MKWMNIWFAMDDETVGIRTFDNIVDTLLGRPSLMEFAFNKKHGDCKSKKEFFENTRRAAFTIQNDRLKIANCSTQKTSHMHQNKQTLSKD
jgi:hypothetical protein